MIARTWIGETLESDADAYFKYLRSNRGQGVQSYRRKPGRLAVAASSQRQGLVCFHFFVGFIRVYQGIRRARVRKGRLLSRGQEVLAGA